MTVKMISTTQLRSQVASIIQGLKKGDRYLIQHYKEVVGYVTPEIPEDLSRKIEGGTGKVK